MPDPSATGNLCTPFPRTPLRDIITYRQFLLLEAPTDNGRTRPVTVERPLATAGSASADKRKPLRLDGRGRRAFEFLGTAVRDARDTKTRDKTAPSSTPTAITGLPRTAREASAAPLERRGAKSVQRLRTIARLDRGPNLAENRKILANAADAMMQAAIEGAMALGDRTSADRLLSLRWAIGIDFEQRWEGRGYKVGRLLRSVPIAAGGSVEVAVKSWSKRTSKRSDVESIERDITDEFVRDEKWSRAVVKAVSNTLNAGVNGKLTGKADVSVPAKAAKVGGGVGGELGGNLSNQLTHSVTDTEERLSQATQKNLEHLKSLVSSTVEIAGESGDEATRTQTLDNPNRCHPLNYHFWEVVEEIAVNTQARRADLYLLVPLTLPTLTKEWVLCHECELRKLLPCDIYYAGFEGAKLLLRQEKLGQFAGALDDASVAAAASMLFAVIGELAGLYAGFTEATFLPGQASMQRSLNFSMQILPDPERLAGEAGKAAEDPIGYIGGKIEEVGNAINDVISGAASDDDGSIVDKIVDTATDAGQKAYDVVVGPLLGIVGDIAEVVDKTTEDLGIGPGGSSTAPTGPRGPGSFLYWQILIHVAPELAAALGSLAGRYEALGALPEGAERNRAIIEAAATFFTEVGDIDGAFFKIDVVLGALAAGGVAAVGALAGAPALAAAPAAAAAGGAVGIVALPAAAAAMAAVASSAVALSGVIAAAIDQFGADVFPNDNGLRARITHLRGTASHAASVAQMPPIVSPSASEEQLAAYEAARREAVAEQRRIAEARIEYERLLCHIKDNLLYYAQAMWARMSPDEISVLAASQGIPTNLVELSFSGFTGHRGALRVIDLDRVKAEYDFDFAGQLALAGVQRLLESDRASVEVQAPTAGVVVEGVLAECSVCDAFVEEHRRLDLEFRRHEVTEKRAMVSQAELEAARFRKRIQTGVLDDPTPFEGNAQVTVEVEKKPDTD